MAMKQLKGLTLTGLRVTSSTTGFCALKSLRDHGDSVAAVQKNYSSNTLNYISMVLGKKLSNLI